MCPNFNEAANVDGQSHVEDLISPITQSETHATPTTPLPPPSGLPPNSFITYSSDGTIRFWNIDAIPSQSHATLTAAASGIGIDVNNIGSYFRRNMYSRELLKIIYTDNISNGDKNRFSNNQGDFLLT